MNEQRKQILDMLAAGKITAAEASDLLDALEGQEKPKTPELKDKRGRKKSLRIDVNANDGSDSAKVKVNVPLSLIKVINPILKSGLVPDKARQELEDKGVDIDKLTEIIDGITDELAETDEDIVTVDAGEDNEGAKVRIYVD